MSMLRQGSGLVSRLGLGALRSQVACATTSFHAKGLASAAAGEVAAKEDFFAQYKEAKAVADSVSLDQAVKEFEKTKKSSPLASKDWWGEAANKSEYYDNPEALAMVSDYFKTLEEDFSFSEEAKREVAKYKFEVMEKVDEYRQLFKEMSKNPYLTDAWEVDWAKMRKDFPDAEAKKHIDFFEAKEKKEITPLIRQQFDMFMKGREQLLLNHPKWQAYKQDMKDKYIGGFAEQSLVCMEEIAKLRQGIAAIESELDALDHITIEECLADKPDLAAEIDAEIERQEW
mmetsp:Transcript_6016/g.12688  ORF Transcript_6016/g.12688 Transcript_6016/m.12688 type:complete len:286 (-) Transcript_6016:63-920(-)